MNKIHKLNVADKMYNTKLNFITTHLLSILKYLTLKQNWSIINFFIEKIVVKNVVVHIALFIKLYMRSI